jgi:putative phosphoribosyl transferase
MQSTERRIEIPADRVLDLNHQALGMLRTEKRLEIVEGATHLFEEPGALERVAALAGDWFARHTATAAGSRPVAV